MQKWLAPLALVFVMLGGCLKVTDTTVASFEVRPDTPGSIIATKSFDVDRETGDLEVYVEGQGNGTLEVAVRQGPQLTFTQTIQPDPLGANFSFCLDRGDYELAVLSNDFTGTANVSVNGAGVYKACDQPAKTLRERAAPITVAIGGGLAAVGGVVFFANQVTATVTGWFAPLRRFLDDRALRRTIAAIAALTDSAPAAKEAALNRLNAEAAAALAKRRISMDAFREIEARIAEARAD